ncbi:hypothetical protein SBA4_3390016 [Candidatus Sulfopaludibacter sp. SbA4]|nr:hypothetical protein SBA4_3390016 [Candidatus Sulfopaludibacter sp. SbA4]
MAHGVPEMTEARYATSSTRNDASGAASGIVIGLCDQALQVLQVIGRVAKERTKTNPWGHIGPITTAAPHSPSSRRPAPEPT